MLSTQHNDKAIHNLVTFCDSTRSSETLIHNQMLQLSGDLDCPIPKIQMKMIYQRKNIFHFTFHQDSWGEMKNSDRFGKL